jgi:hypothetical protein
MTSVEDEIISVVDARRDYKVSGVDDTEELGEKNDSEVQKAEAVRCGVYEDVREVDLDEYGKERPIGAHFFISGTFRANANDLPTVETDIDVATRLISLQDDPTLPIFTFRTCFLGLGLSSFGAVLGQILVCLVPPPLVLR